jgi:hypothetical protein
MAAVAREPPGTLVGGDSEGGAPKDPWIAGLLAFVPTTFVRGRAAAACLCARAGACGAGAHAGLLG